MPPPAVANAIAKVVIESAYGTLTTRTSPRIRAAQAYRRVAAATIEHHQGRVTPDELGEQVAFAAQEALAAIPGSAGLPGAGTAPAWAVAMNNNINNSINTLRNDMNKRFNQVDDRLDLVEARLANAMLTEPSDPISPLRNKVGDSPPACFPADLKELANLNNTQVEQLLQFYGLPKDPSVTSHSRLRKFLGIK